MDDWYIEQEARRFEGIDPVRWRRLPVAIRAEAVAHWNEHNLREAEAAHCGKRKAEREAKTK